MDVKLKSFSYYINKIVEMIYEWRSILAKASKPSPEEFNAIIKVVFLSMAVIGTLSYLIKATAVMFLFK
ncbi:hypothetical protein EYM_03380 [Ignicoccus islandicus DSM 13165]|uniref:Protein translocase subunit SecE n=1 Tax=Ignicoccus islandicus DSM 13165 TaxID=940295 RepID=A0A0U2WN82_9CREN|nr:protein translocase SEC61 complex subunit gamma [Ignicoccus islandicus]ALU12401.1 hypothetical protein EYM_03380 [Ignicoccus islandicus DSM 13165]